VAPSGGDAVYVRLRTAPSGAQIVAASLERILRPLADGWVCLDRRETSEGFDNDLLPTQGFLQIMVELTVLGR
jgi:hypothetical protein